MEINEIIKPENLVYGKPRLMNENPMHYCPGCSHGVIHKLIAEVIVPEYCTVMFQELVMVSVAPPVLA